MDLKTKDIPAESDSSLAEKIPVLEEPREFRLAFVGSGGEYFRIWIVNTLLTVVTLGLYSAWAKVRTRRYFYAHTLIGEHPFEYLADPVAILKGNLIIGGGFLLYVLADAYKSGFSALIAILFYLMLPFLIYKSLRFYTHNSSFRNIRFRFTGNLGDSYTTYLLMPLFLVPLTLGLIIPYWALCRRQYFFGNLAFGNAKNIFDGKPKPFYKFYAVALAGGMLLVVLGIFSLQPFLTGFFRPDAGTPIQKGFVFMAIASYLVMLVVFSIVQQYLFAHINNYCWEHSRLGKVRFRSTLGAQELLWIRLTNMIAIILTLGFFIPWAKVRRTRYILENLTVIAHGDLDDFAAAAEPEASAVGDSAMDFFDIEIGF